MKVGDEVTIKNEALVGQDFQFFDWKEGDIIFKIEEIIGTDNRCKLVADGYGKLKEPDMYGNGAVYVNVNNLIKIKEKNLCSKSFYVIMRKDFSVWLSTDGVPDRFDDLDLAKKSAEIYNGRAVEENACREIMLLRNKIYKLEKKLNKEKK